MTPRRINQGLLQTRRPAEAEMLGNKEYERLWHALLYEGWNFNFGNAAGNFWYSTPTEFIFSQTLDVLHNVMLNTFPAMRDSPDAFGSPCFVDGPDGAVYSGRLDPPLQLSYTVMLRNRKPLPVHGNSFALLPLPASILTKNAALV